MNKQVVYSEEYKRVRKCISYIVLYHSNTSDRLFGEIMHYLHCNDNNGTYAVINNLIPEKHPLLDHYDICQHIMKVKQSSLW